MAKTYTNTRGFAARNKKLYASKPFRIETVIAKRVHELRIISRWILCETQILIAHRRSSAFDSWDSCFWPTFGFVTNFMFGWFNLSC